jgi:RNA polymerase primary sigma factor
MDTADLVQEGSSALLRAAEDFEPERGYRFSTYARWWVNQAFLRTMYNNLRTVRLPVYLQKAAAKVMRSAGDRDFRDMDLEALSSASGVPVSTIRILHEFSRSTVSMDAGAGDRDSVMAIEDARGAFRPESLDRPNLRGEVERALSGLDARERMILKLRFGLDARFPRTLEEVGERMNLSRERVRQIQEEAFEKLRSPLHLERLRDLLDIA